MTQVGEAVAVANTKEDKTKCPFCEKDLHSFMQEQEGQVSYSVTSKPEDLEPLGDMAGPNESYPWTKARHHLISAKQCYAKIRTLVRLGYLYKYDINDTKNGIALPTISKNITYPSGTSRKAYGQFDDDGKKHIAFTVMRKTKAQWHVGHHAVKIPKNWGEEVNNEQDQGHTIQYDSIILEYLLALLDRLKKPDAIAPCEAEDQEKMKKKFHQEMNDESDRVRTALNRFDSNKPWNPEKLYVSRLAYLYAREKFDAYERQTDPSPEENSTTANSSDEGIVSLFG